MPTKRIPTQRKYTDTNHWFQSVRKADGVVHLSLAVCESDPAIAAATLKAAVRNCALAKLDCECNALRLALRANGTIK